MSDQLDKNSILISQEGFEKQKKALYKKQVEAARFTINDSQWEDVLGIVREVAKNGDDAVAKYTRDYDKVDLTPEQFLVPKEELKKAHAGIKPELLKSIRQAIENVRKYQKEIYVGDFKHPGIKYTPIKRVGICVPGASAPLPSTVIMTAVPAQVAGVSEIAVVSPPRYNGSIHPVILAVCHELKITEVYRIGGAQAVAALAAGTKQIAKVDKIAGPGNKWVQTAKNMVTGTYVAIDSIAGPSEVLIIANEQANPAWVAADMLSQAEHDPGWAFVFTNSKPFAAKVYEQLQEQIEQLDRSQRTAECLNEFGRIVECGDMDDIIEAANDFAAEHLQVQCGDESRKIADRIENAGAIFIGDYSPVAVGDYWAGPSHTLPTGQTAKFFSALSANDFIKSTSIIEYDKKKLADSAEDIIRLAETEGLGAHAMSVKIRQKK